jgi:hypothetical protein
MKVEFLQAGKKKHFFLIVLAIITSKQNFGMNAVIASNYYNA